MLDINYVRQSVSFVDAGMMFCAVKHHLFHVYNSVYLTLGWPSTVSDNNNVPGRTSQGVFFSLYAPVKHVLHACHKSCQTGGTGRTLCCQTFWRSGEGNTKRCLFRVQQLPKRARATVSPTIRFIRTCLSPVGALFLCRASLGLYQVNAQQLLEHVLVWRVGSI